MKILLSFLFSVVILISACNNKHGEAIENSTDSCIGKRDTAFKVNFSKDTSETDFYQLISYIESKKSLVRFINKSEKDITKQDFILLQKVLCEKRGFDSPIERWLLENLFSLRCDLISKQKNQANRFIVTLSQLNFKTEQEKNTALSLINKIGWGDPLKKWNEPYIIKSKTRIIILEAGDANAYDIVHCYGQMIQTEWANRYNY